MTSHYTYGSTLSPHFGDVMLYRLLVITVVFHAGVAKAGARESAELKINK